MQASAIRFTFYGPDRSVQTRRSTNNIVFVGSAANCEIRLPGLSAHHCLVSLDARGYHVQDLAGGIQVNGNPTASTILQDNDVLTVGQFAIRINMEWGLQPRQQQIRPVAAAAAPVVIPVQAKPPKKRSALRSCFVGCTGIFLLLGLVAFGLYVWWAQPSWMTKYYFWRPEPFHAEDEVPDPARQASQLKDEESRYENLQKQSRDFEGKKGMRLNGYVSKVVRANEGGRLITPEGASVDVPPGAIPHDAVIEFAPRVAPGNGQMTGGLTLLSDVYVIRVDGQEHTNFHAPVTVEIPAVTRMSGRDLPANQIVPLFWDGQQWQQYNSSVSVEPGKFRFRISHATDLTGGIKWVAGMAWDGVKWVGGVGQSAATGLSQVTGTSGEIASWYGAGRGWDAKYETTNFAIYYVSPTSTKYPSDRVPDDASYKLAGGRKPQAHPLYVIDVGTFLEFAHAHAKDLGLTPAKALVERHAVFLENLGGYGESPIGGPIYLDNDMSGLPGSVDWGEFLRTTCTHEYMHVLQDEYYTNVVGGNSQNSWIETSAESLSSLLRSKAATAEHPNPFMTTAFYTNAEPQFLQKPPEGEGKGVTDKVNAYAWAAFFEWMDTDGGHSGYTTAVLDQASSNFSFSGVLSSMEGAAGQGKSGATLADAFARFCQAYFHDDVTTGRIHSRSWWQDRANLRLMADANLKDLYFRMPVTSRNGPAYFYHSIQVKDLNHLTARYFFLDGQYMKNPVAGKVVLRFENVASEGAVVQVYRDTYENDLPTGSGPGPESITLKSGSEKSVIVDRFGDVYTASGKQTQTNRLNFVFLNSSISEDGRDFKLRAWLLLPPENVTFDRKKGENMYTVRWNESPLAAQDKTDSTVPFKGYNIYRRKLGERAWPSTPVNDKPVQDTKYEDHLTDTSDQEYSVTVIDDYDNESEKSLVLNDDPFVGDWGGSIRLTQGHLLDINKFSEEQKTMYKGIIEWVNELEGIAKLGIPVEFEIERADAQYWVKAKSIMGKQLAVDESDRTGPFERVSEHNLMWNPPRDGEDQPPPVYLRIQYPNVIEGDQNFETGAFSWHFDRKNPPEPSTPGPPAIVKSH